MKIDAVLATKGGTVFTAQPDESIQDAVAVLSQHNIGALVVIDDAHHVIGILSERDVVRRAAHDDQVLSRTVRELMIAKVITGSPHDDLEIVMRTMTQNHFRHLPIVENDKLIGIVALGDLVKARLDHYIGEVENLQTQLS